MDEQLTPPMANYQDLKELCLEIAVEVGPPVFYREKGESVETSRKAFEQDETVQKCLGMVAREGFFAGHAEAHIRKVAIDAGAIVLIETDGLPANDQLGQRLSFLAHIAGVLHDIKRSQPEHARLGALEAERLLVRFDLKEAEQRMIVKAIANHEAFQPSEPLESSDAQLLSDALYDADKFQWGPENFTVTLWAMLALRKTENIPLLFQRFPQSMEGIERIRSTFRTHTGKTYGPDFIDRGLLIGRRLLAQYRNREKD
jgi:HD superfamily phosphohydrolase YqeK